MADRFTTFGRIEEETARLKRRQARRRVSAAKKTAGAARSSASVRIETRRRERAIRESLKKALRLGASGAAFVNGVLFLVSLAVMFASGSKPWDGPAVWMLAPLTALAAVLTYVMSTLGSRYAAFRDFLLCAGSVAGALTLAFIDSFMAATVFWPLLAVHFLTSPKRKIAGESEEK